MTSYTPDDPTGPPTVNIIPDCPQMIGDLVQNVSTGFVTCVTRVLPPTGYDAEPLAATVVVIACGIALGVVFMLANRNSDGRPRT